MNRPGKLALLTLLTLTACNQVDKTSQISRNLVVDIPSGDTLIVGYQGERYQVQLCGVDVPLERQAQAKKLLTTLLQPFLAEDKTVIVNLVATKSGERMAEVSIPSPLLDNPEAEKDLSSELLLAGLAKVSLDKCPNRDVFLSAQQDAQERKVGIWSQK